MKLIHIINFFALLGVSSTALATPKIHKLKVNGAIPSALRGGTSGVGGGGDSVALEFQQYAAQALHEIQLKPEIYGKLPISEILAILPEVQVAVVDEALDISTKELIQNSTAVNIPEQNLILVNRNRWSAIEDVRMRKAIAVHETLSLKKIEQTGYYPVSSKYLNAAGIDGNELAANLKVNRLRQLQVQNPNKSAGEILEKFYNEAKEDISLSDIPSLEAGISGKVVCQMAKRNGDLSAKDASYFVSDVIIRPSKPSNGPLFPGQPEVKEKRILYMQFSSSHRYSYKKNPKKFIESLLSSAGESVLGSKLIVKKDELIQSSAGYSDGITRYSPSTQSFKRNNGLLVFKLGHTEYWGLPEGNLDNSAMLFGYCYNVNN